jgi:tetratricopeptide (TPR) repeat protein
LVKDKPTAQNFYLRYKYYIDKAEYAMAMEDLTNAIAKDSVNANYHFAKVKLLRKMHRVPQAIKYAQSVEKYLSNNQDFYISLAEMYFILKNIKKL